MTNLWPWLAVAGVGALHGLNPATGWMFAVAIGVRSGDRAQALRALIPIALGHALSIALVAAAVALGASMEREGLIAVSATVLVVTTLVHVSHGRLPNQRKQGSGTTPRNHASQVALTLYSFAISTAHGSGLMLVPALIPLCSSNTPGRELTASGSLTVALAVIAVHTTAMLFVTGAVAASACRGFEAGTHWLRNLQSQLRLRG